MTWMDPNPDVHADFADAARLANHGPAPSSPIFTAAVSRGEAARSPIRTGSAGPAARPFPPAAQRDRPPSERAT